VKLKNSIEANAKVSFARIPAIAGEKATMVEIVWRAESVFAILVPPVGSAAGETRKVRGSAKGNPLPVD
jgi:hypothetical protein